MAGRFRLARRILAGGMIAIAVGIIAVMTQLLGLVGGAAAADETWPRWMEPLRQHRWVAFPVLVVLVGGGSGIYAWLEFRRTFQRPNRRTADGEHRSGAPDRASVTHRASWRLGRQAVGVGGNVVHGDLNVFGGSGLAVSATSPSPAGVPGTSAVPMCIKFAKKGQIHPQWWRALVETLYQHHDRVPLIAEQAVTAVPVGPGTDLLIVIFGSAQFESVIESVIDTIRDCRRKNPTANVLVAGCDLTESQLQSEEIHRSLSAAGLSDLIDVAVFPDASTDRFVEWLESGIGTVDMITKLLEGRPQSQDDQQTPEGGDL